MEYPQWSKSHPSCGRNYRIQRNVYAMRVAMVMTKGARVCPCCSAPLDMSSDTAQQVDRVNPALDYGTLGNIVYVCEACNQGRALLQRVGKDWRNVKRYAADVMRASASVTVPSIPEALREWDDMRKGRGGSVSRYA
jgi:hypothetical protein